ncbi:MAG: hypothetical protein QM699_07815 [Amaricoccus sp.]|uniref:hypothetical protein n=1 Tax=Amaricoccus sp. TaxID=1872485 RepID=UPI0039E706F0
MSSSPDARSRIEWNLNTILSGLGLLVMVLGGGYFINDQQRDIGELKDWRVDLETELKDRRGEVEGKFGGINARDNAQDEQLRKTDALANQNAYRVAEVEARGEALDSQLNDLSRQLNDQSGELKVIREILNRIEAAQQRGESQPPQRQR